MKNKFFGLFTLLGTCFIATYIYKLHKKSLLNDYGNTDEGYNLPSQPLGDDEETVEHDQSVEERRENTACSINERHKEAGKIIKDELESFNNSDEIKIENKSKLKSLKEGFNDLLGECE